MTKSTRSPVIASTHRTGGMKQVIFSQTNNPHPIPSGHKPSVLYISYDGMLEPLGRNEVILMHGGRRVFLNESIG